MKHVNKTTLSFNDIPFHPTSLGDGYRGELPLPNGTTLQVVYGPNFCFSSGEVDMTDDYFLAFPDATFEVALLDGDGSPIVLNDAPIEDELWQSHYSLPHQTRDDIDSLIAMQCEIAA
jgi:hypothetical protein